MARSTFVAEEELAVGDEGTELRQRRCLNVGENMWVVIQLMTIALSCLFLFA